MSVLEVRNLCKRYPNFLLDQVSFSMEKGRIMGFIGRNGAGKTTTLRSLLNLVHPDSGEIIILGEHFKTGERTIKERIGFVSGGIDYYAHKKLRVITSVTRRFYPLWDDEAYTGFMKSFALDVEKTPSQLSAGMKVKYELALALSHHAQLLILDEPTSGLDPVSREDLLEIFLSLQQEGVSILFSTHITADLDKCADDITYIKSGKILASMDCKSFKNQYLVAKLTPAQAEDEGLKPRLIGCRPEKEGFSALVLSSDGLPNIPLCPAELDDIMVHLEKE